MHDVLPCLDLLEATPAILRGLMSGISAEDARWKPAADRFSDAAVVRHRYQGAGSFEGTPFTDDHRCVMVWEKQAGEWRLVMEQCSSTS